MNRALTIMIITIIDHNHDENLPRLSLLNQKLKSMKHHQMQKMKVVVKRNR